MQGGELGLGADFDGRARGLEQEWAWTVGLGGIEDGIGIDERIGEGVPEGRIGRSSEKRLERHGLISCRLRLKAEAEPEVAQQGGVDFARTSGFIAEQCGGTDE